MGVVDSRNCEEFGRDHRRSSLDPVQQIASKRKEAKEEEAEVKMPKETSLCFRKRVSNKKGKRTKGSRAYERDEEFVDQRYLAWSIEVRSSAAPSERER